MRAAFLLPVDLPGPSGGTNYNEALAETLDGALPVRPIPGAWPRPAPADRRALAKALASTPVALVDGIIALAAPEVIAAATGVTVHILLHSLLSSDTSLSETERREFEESETAALQGADSVIVTSHWAARDIRVRYRARAVHAVPPGTAPAPAASGSDPPALLCLAALTPVKNQLTAVAALAQLTDLPWSAHLVGSPRIAPAYAAAVRRAAAEFEPGRITVPGALTGPPLEEVWRQTNLLVLPSVSETYGMVVAEAIARGIPAIVPAGTGAVEALSAGGPGAPAPGSPAGPPPEFPGAAVDPRDPSALAAALRGWLARPAERERWREIALVRRSGLRSWARVAGEVNAILTA